MNANQPITDSSMARKMKSLKRKLFVNRNQFQIDISRETRQKRAQMLYIAKEERFHCATTMWKGFEWKKVKTKSEIDAIKQLICLNLSFSIISLRSKNEKTTTTT
jgi:hypothetical protein